MPYDNNINSNGLKKILPLLLPHGDVLSSNEPHWIHPW